MLVHILNGDSVAGTFAETNIPGQRIVCREALIEGPVQAADLYEFWANRAAFLSGGNPAEAERYHQGVAQELSQLLSLPADAEVHLWFEDDLFCQSNMWFVLALLAKGSAEVNIYRVFPIQPEQDHWRGFGPVDAAGLEQAYAQKVAFQSADFALGVQLWEAYIKQDLERLQVLAQQASPCFNRLAEVVQAHVERFAPQGQLGRPEQLIAELMQENPEDFNALLVAFWKKEGIYGFGDVQVRGMYERLLGAGELI